MASPFRGVSWRSASAPARPGGLSFSVLLPISFGVQSAYGSCALVGSHFYTTAGCSWCLALIPSGRASSVCLRLLFTRCGCQPVFGGPYCGRESWEFSARSSVLPFPGSDTCLAYVPQFGAPSELLTHSIPRSF